MSRSPILTKMTTGHASFWDDDAGWFVMIKDTKDRFKDSGLWGETEAITLISQGHAPDEAFEQARTQFTEEELVNLTLAIIAINGGNRLAIAFREVPGTYSTQFFEFVSGIAQSGTVGQTVHLSPALVQPIVSDDVADAMADVTLGAPVNGTIEIAGPERVRLAELVQRFLSANQDPREVVTDVHARYFGVQMSTHATSA